MARDHGKGAWNRLRFDWKKQINRSSFVSRSAKQMASYLCDECVNRDTGQFFHGNDFLAKGLNVDKRSIQRNLRELKCKGWLMRVRVAGKRRAYQLTFPAGLGAGLGRERDKELEQLTPELSSERDTDDAPIINQVYNNTDGAKDRRPLATVFVHEREHEVIAGWKAWIHENTERDVEVVMQLLRTRGGFLLPSRYPREDARDIIQQKRHFEEFENAKSASC